MYVLITKKFQILAISSISIILLFFSIFFANIKDIVIFPFNDEFSNYIYTDEPVGGNSNAFYIHSDSIISLKYHLGQNFHSPYIGITFFNKLHKFFPVSSHNELQIEIKSSEPNRVGIAFFTPLDDENQKMFHNYLNISDEYKVYNLPLNKFSYPEWWADQLQIAVESLSNSDKKEIVNMNIGTAYNPSKLGGKFIEIRSLKIVRNNKSLYFILLIIEMFSVLIVVSLQKIKRRKKEVTVLYKPIEIDDKSKNEIDFIEFINENIYDSDLSLIKIAETLSISQRIITEQIQKDFGTNFNSYINRIRINEAKRLLENSDLNISEIAFKVGFNSHSHFNRVFKNEENISPTAYRNKT